MLMPGGGPGGDGHWWNWLMHKFCMKSLRISGPFPWKAILLTEQLPAILKCNHAKGEISW